MMLLAYPQPVRRRDGADLLDLALELAADHGVVREAIGLLRGGLGERRRRGRTRRAVAGVLAVAALVLAGLTWTATAQPVRAEEDRYSCSTSCAAVEAEVDDKVRDGWTCTEHRGPVAVSWRCTRD